MIVPEVIAPGEVVTQEEIASFWEKQISFVKKFDSQVISQMISEIDRVAMPSLIFTSAPMPQLAASEFAVNVSWSALDMRLVLETDVEDGKPGEVIIYAVNSAQESEDGFRFFYEFDSISDISKTALEEANDFLVMMSRIITHRLKFV